MNFIPRSCASRSSAAMSYGADTLINIDPSFRKKTDLESLPSTSSALRPLIDDDILAQAAKTRVPKTPHFIDRDYLGLCICNITVNAIILPHKSWTFKFDLWLKNKSKWYYHTFTMNKEKFKQLHANITFNENNTDKGQSILFFPKHSYPKPPPLTVSARSDELKQSILKETQYLKKPQLPSTWGLLKKTANMDYAQKYALYLQHCFSSLSLCIQSWFYQLLDKNGLNEKLAKYLRGIAYKRLDTMIKKTLAKNCSIKRLSRRNEFKFHTCYITTRPLHDPSTNLLNFNHWALKFEGELSLLTIEFFAAQKGVKIRHYMNSTMSRRIFWYWWDPDPLYKEDENGNNLIYFTNRWKVIERFTFDDSKHISAPLLSHIVEKWLTTGQNKKYHVFKNNCQHFVRDIVAVLDRKVALSLNSFMDHTTLTNLLPVVAIGDGLAEHARTLEISKQLGDALNEYGKKTKERKMEKARIRALSKSSSKSGSKKDRENKDNKTDDKYVRVMDNENDNDNDNHGDDEKHYTLND